MRAIFAGHHVWPDRHEPIFDLFSSVDLERRFQNMREAIRSAVITLPELEAFVQACAR
jgi:hypothetical protein